jgi:hypothetical protein
MPLQFAIDAENRNVDQLVTYLEGKDATGTGVIVGSF